MNKKELSNSFEDSFAFLWMLLLGALFFYFSWIANHIRATNAFLIFSLLDSIFFISAFYCTNFKLFLECLMHPLGFILTIGPVLIVLLIYLI